MLVITSTAILSLFLSASPALAAWSGNLNYRSPSHHHPSLGLSIYRINKRTAPNSAIPAAKLNFTHGVASGDPTEDSVILWTRASPMFDDNKSNVTVEGTAPLYGHQVDPYVAASDHPVCVQYRVAKSSQFSDIADSGTAYTTSDVDFTVKVEAKNLEPFTQYYYQFNICNSNKRSPVGRTKTAPSANQKVGSIGLAVYSCSNFPFGFFNAYGNPARKDSVDYVVHLGDYIYEYQNGEYGDGSKIGRVPLPDRTIYTLYDYRKRLATYRTDLDLLESHQQFAWIPVWDDHEVSDNTWKAGSSMLFNTEGSFVADGGVSVDQRKMNAVRAYFEWMPIRQVDMDDNLRIWRSFSLGTLLDLIMLDTRHYDRSITDIYTNTGYVHQISNDAGRSMMGSRQENWFYNQLSKSADRGATWRLIGSQTVFSRQNQSFAYGNQNPLDYDAWDGYQSNRDRTLQHLYQNNIGNNIVMAGDSHLSWVSDLVWLEEEKYSSQSGAGAIGVEFAGSGVTSPCPFGHFISQSDANKAAKTLVGANQELQWQDTYYRGYYELHVGYDKVEARYFGMPTVVTRNPLEISLANFTVLAGQNHLQRPVAGGKAASGYLRGGVIHQGNITNNTNTGRYSITHFPQEVSS